MRCDCCNVILSPKECTRKFKESGEFTNTCTRCLNEIDVPTVEGAFFESDDTDDTKSYTEGLFDNDDLDEI